MTAPVIGFTVFYFGNKALSVNIQETKNVYKVSIVPVAAHWLANAINVLINTLVTYYLYRNKT